MVADVEVLVTMLVRVIVSCFCSRCYEIDGRCLSIEWGNLREGSLEGSDNWEVGPEGS